jgi:hypothetical protein
MMEISLTLVEVVTEQVEAKATDEQIENERKDNRRGDKKKR